MPSSSSDPFLTLAVLTALGPNRSLHQHLCRPSHNPTMSLPGQKPARCIYGMYGPSSSLSTYPASLTIKPVHTPPHLRSHPTVAPRVSQWTGLRPATPIHRRSGCSLETSVPRFTLPQRAKPDLTPCHNPSQPTHLPWKTCNGALPNHPSSLRVQQINPSRSGMSESKAKGVRLVSTGLMRPMSMSSAGTG
jgi:hypothetical protein